MWSRWEREAIERGEQAEDHAADIVGRRSPEACRHHFRSADLEPLAQSVGMQSEPHEPKAAYEYTRDEFAQHLIQSALPPRAQVLARG